MLFAAATLDYYSLFAIFACRQPRIYGFSAAMRSSYSHRIARRSQVRYADVASYAMPAPLPPSLYRHFHAIAPAFALRHIIIITPRYFALLICRCRCQPDRMAFRLSPAPLLLLISRLLPLRHDDADTLISLRRDAAFLRQRAAAMLRLR